MKMASISRTRKIGALIKLFAGNAAPLTNLRKPLSSDLSMWTDEELRTERERLRQKHYRETGVLPSPMPDLSAMSDDELDNYVKNLKVSL